MKIKRLFKKVQKPEVYTKGTAEMWIDEYISTKLLETHLNPDIDLASRKQTTILRTVEWMLEKAPGEKLNILDLGCGPGLYSEKLAKRGHIVTGMDFSSTSINYARESAKRKNLDISYVEKNYLGLDEVNRYDLIIMIFTDFGVLIPDDRKRVLENIQRALKVGGIFLFDVLNESYPLNKAGSRSWELSEKGFWKDTPYLALSESFFYDEQNVALDQHIIIDDKGEIDVFRFWIHTFSHTDLEAILVSHGFREIKCYDHVIPGSSMYRSEKVTFCVATK